MRKRLRKLLGELVGIAGALGAVWGSGWYIWIVWGEYIKELFRAAAHVTTHSVVWGGAAILVIASAVRIAETRFPWLKRSIYYLLSHLFGGRLRRGVQELDDAFADADHKYSFLSTYFHHTSDHWLAYKVEEWALRILHVVFWPVVIVTGTHMLQEDERTASGYALTVAVMVLIYTVIGARLRNMLLLGCVASWLAYIVLTQGGIEAEAQGLVIGAIFVLWTAWCEWQRHISGNAEPANEDEDDDEEDEEGPEPGPGKSN